jgi:protein-tyrosine-phosphatase
VYGAATIERFLLTSYNEFAERATVVNFLPLLAERFAHQRLQALARVEGHHKDGKPVGSEPTTGINPSAVAAMTARGIDISSEYPKPWTDEVVRAADVVISMGCGDACPVVPGKRYEEWTVDDPADLSVTDVRPIRDEVERHVLTLLAELDLPSRTTA